VSSLTNRIAAVQACLNGSRSPAEHAAVPVTAAELAAAAASAVAAGAGSLHLHAAAGRLRVGQCGRGRLAGPDRCAGAAGIGAEAGVWSAADAQAAGRAGGWLRIPVEISGVSAAEAAGRADEILGLLQAGGVTVPVLLHGEDDSCWPLLARAGQLGLATRIGLEDILSGSDGQDVADNAELVRLALAEWTAARTA